MRNDNGISLRLIKRKVKNHLMDDNISEISNDVLVVIQTSLDSILDEWITLSLKEFHDINHFREIQGVKALKRLDADVFKITEPKLFITESSYKTLRDRTNTIEILSCKADEVEVV